MLLVYVKRCMLRAAAAFSTVRELLVENPSPSGWQGLYVRSQHQATLYCSRHGRMGIAPDMAIVSSFKCLEPLLCRIRADIDDFSHVDQIKYAKDQLVSEIRRALLSSLPDSAGCLDHLSISANTIR